MYIHSVLPRPFLRSGPLLRHVQGVAAAMPWPSDGCFEIVKICSTMSSNTILYSTKLNGVYVCNYPCIQAVGQIPGQSSFLTHFSFFHSF